MKPKALAVTAVVAVLAGCGSTSSHPPHHSPAAKPTAAASSAPDLTCASESYMIQTLVSDQESQNKSLEEGWINISDGSLTSQGNDLQNAATAWQNAPGGPIAYTASQLSTDATNFFASESGGLAPGWPAGYRAIQYDIAQLAANCGIKYHDDSYYLNR
jgi:hypothetical protein